MRASKGARVAGAALAAATLAACSGNMTGGATPPVSQVPVGASGAVVPQSAAVSRGGVPSPAVAATPAQIVVAASATPYPLPQVGAYGGTIVLSAAAPQGVEEPLVDLLAVAPPVDAPPRPAGTPKSRATHPLLEIDVAATSGDTMLAGLGAVVLQGRTTLASDVRHLAVGLFETRIPAGPRMLFRRKAVSTRSIAFDPAPKIGKDGRVVSADATPIVFHEGRHYAIVYYADRLPDVAPSPDPGRPDAGGPPARGAAPGTSPGIGVPPGIGASPGASPGVGASPAPVASFGVGASPTGFGSSPAAAVFGPGTAGSGSRGLGTATTPAPATSGGSTP